MAENPLVDLAIDVMINRFGLDETEYTLFKFSEGAKAVTIGMTNGEVPVTVTFPTSVMEIEKIKRWSLEKKVLYLRSLRESEEQLDPALNDVFYEAMLEMEMPRDKKSRNVEEEVAAAAMDEESVEEIHEKELSEDVEPEPEAEIEEKPKKSTSKKKAAKKAIRKKKK